MRPAISSQSVLEPASQRREEIRRLHRLSADELVQQARGTIKVLENLDELYAYFARSIASTMAKSYEAGKDPVLILPYGPTAQYPLLSEILNREKLSLRRATIFFMDEYADDEGKAVPPSHPLSFQGGMVPFWESLNEDLRPAPENVIFPNESNAEGLAGRIRELGGVDVCYGGVGIHGHVAFNEPEAGVRGAGPRLVRLNDFTVTLNALRAGVGGDVENFPRLAWTLGMQECLGARRIELYCRSDIPGTDWGKTVLRLAACGTPGDDYPVTWIREHPDWTLVTDQSNIAPPKALL